MMEWLQLLLPAWIMGTLLVFLTAPLGCLMLWRRMSFFADTMAHGTLLGVAIAGAMALPLWLGVAFIAACWWRSFGFCMIRVYLMTHYSHSVLQPCSARV